MPIQPTPSDVHVNQMLTNVSIAYVQDADSFVASKFAPVLPVDHQSDKYWQILRGQWNRSQMEVRGPGLPAKRIGYAVQSTDTYYANVYALAHPIPDQTRKNADAALDQDRLATRLLTQQDLIKRELVFVNNFLQTSKWTTDTTGVSSGPSGAQVLQWNNANSTPLEDIAKAKQTIIQNTGIEPMHLVIGYPVWVALKNHPEIIARVSGGATTAIPAKVQMALIAQLMELDEILVMKSIQNTAADGATDSNAFIGGKVALLGYVEKELAPECATACATFAWKGYTGMNDNATRIKQYRDENCASDIIEAESAWDQKLISPDLGNFFTSLVA